MPKPPRNKQRGLRWGQGSVIERNGRYQARWFDGNGKRRAQTFDSLDAAEEHVRRMARGGYADPGEMTVADLLAEHLARADGRIAPSTLGSYRQRAKHSIIPQIGAVRVADMDPLRVQRWIDGLRASDLAANTIRLAVGILSAAFHEALGLGVVDRNPVAGVSRPSMRRPPMRVWTADEARRVLLGVADDPLYGALYAVALATGMRPGELRGLCWDCVDLDAGTILVKRTMARNASGIDDLAERTKGKRDRAVAIGPGTIARLRWHRARQAERRLACGRWHDRGLVFDRGDGHWLDASSWRLRHTAICRTAGVPIITLHALRHTSATILLGQNVSPKIISEILGHRSITTTLDIYAHVDIRMQQQVAELWDEITQPSRRGGGSG